MGARAQPCISLCSSWLISPGLAGWTFAFLPLSAPESCLHAGRPAPSPSRTSLGCGLNHERMSHECVHTCQEQQQPHMLCL
ncbi:hypothetical protein V8C86DRAFT_2570508 [Haematococcus lacustris]